MKIPFNDLTRIHKPLEQELNAAWQRVTANNSYILGREVDEFEDLFGKYLGFSGMSNVAGVSNGTDGLELVLRTMSIGENDEVITVPNTFNATASAIRTVGAKPVLVDINPETKLIDTSLIEKAITTKTKAIMPVHLYGQQADMTGIQHIASAYGLKVIGDACQAHGSTQFGLHPGAVGDATVFSFYPGKNLGAFGDGGAVVSNDSDLISKIKKMREYGQSKKYYHDEQGFNRRLDAIQAAVLSVKLPHLDSWNKSRLESAKKISADLTDVDNLNLPVTANGNLHVYHLYVIEADKRDELAQFLSNNGIQTGIHYPIPIHLQKAFDYLGKGEGSFPVTESSAKRLLSLPIFPFMRADEIQHLTDTVKKFYQAKK